MVQLHYFPANANAAPHMLLEEIGVKYDLVLVDRAKDAQKSRDYLKINPNGRIPTLVDQNLIVSEAAAIVLHLVDQHADAGLAPAVGTPERAKFYQWLHGSSLRSYTEYRAMTKSVMHRLAKDFRAKSKRSFAVLKKTSGAHIKVGLVAAVVFASAYTVETKAILALESSQDLFKVTADHGQSMYR